MLYAIESKQCHSQKPQPRTSQAGTSHGTTAPALNAMLQEISTVKGTDDLSSLREQGNIKKANKSINKYCFACMYVCAPHPCLVPEEVRRRLELQVAVSRHMNTGN